MTGKGPKDPWAVTLRLAAAGVVTAMAAGCGGGATTAPAPAIDVVTALYPLAAVAAEVGGAHVRVVDVIPDGADPTAPVLPASAPGQLAQATLVVDVGGGYQPAFEKAAAAKQVVSLVTAPGAGAAGPWLDPHTITTLAGALAAALSAANPGARAAYANGARDVAAEMSSVAADFQNSLSDCPRHRIVTADGTFAAMSARFGLVDETAGSAAQVRAAKVTTVFSEPWVPAGTVTAAAAGAGVRLRPLDTLIGAPAGGWPKGATLSRLLENDLATITAALQCAQMGQS